MTPWLEGLAISASAACLVHCLGVPLLFALLPAASSLLGVPESFHLVAFIIAVPASGLALLSGYRRHGAMLPVLCGAGGLLLLGAGALGGQAYLVETGLTVIGSLVLGFGHLRNWRLRLDAFSARNR